VNTKKIYTAIAVIFGLAYTNNLFWFFKTLVEPSRYEHLLFDKLYLIRQVIIFAGITGLIIFIYSSFKRSNLIRIMMCFQIISFPFNIFWYILLFTKNANGLNQRLPVTWATYFNISITVIIFISSVVGLRLLSFNKTARLTTITSNGERSAEFSPANLGVRFANRLVDFAMMIYIIVMNVAPARIFLYDYKNTSPEVIILLEIPFLLLYYILLEGIFNITAGKCASGTIITNKNGKRPGFTQVLGRAFCRLIPFEAFSFFAAGRRGWHDTLTNTYVVKAVNKEDAIMDEIIFDAELENVSS